MTTSEFLTANREEVINYYNDNIKDDYSVSLKDFMTDLLKNFRKQTTCEEYKKFDLYGNLIAAKSRLGLMTTIVIADDKITNNLRNKYKGTAYMSMI